MDIRDTALRFLANRDRTCREVREHLIGKGFDESSAVKLMQELKDWNYINDRSYAEKYFRYAGRKGRSIYRMKQELLQKGIAVADMEEALHRWEEEEGSLIQRDIREARREALKITGGMAADEKTTARIGRRLGSLGYSAELIYRVLEECRKGRVEDGTD
jgi:regulatory protein